MRSRMVYMLIAVSAISVALGLSWAHSRTHRVSAADLASAEQPFFCQDDICFLYEPSLASGVSATLEAAWDSDAYPRYRPEHVQIRFSGYPVLGDVYDGPIIHIFPVEDFRRNAPEAEQQIALLQTLIRSRRNWPSESQEALPFLPLENAGMDIAIGPRYLQFRNGAGVRYVARLAQDLMPLQQESLFYTFQGLSDDSGYYVTIIFPLRFAFALPPSNTINLGDYDQITDYNQHVKKMALAIGNAAFFPQLDGLDAFVTGFTTANSEVSAFDDTPTIGVGHEVIVTSNLRLRDRPNPEGTVLTTMTANTHLQIVSGPQTSGGYIWWQIEGIDDESLHGWAVQNWMQVLPWSTVPNPPTPTSTHTPMPPPAPTKQTILTPPVPRPGATPIQPTQTPMPTPFDLSTLARFESGDVVQTIVRVDVRSTASSSSEVTTVYTAGVKLRTLASERDSTGTLWWQVQPLTASHAAGWIPETRLRLVPPSKDSVTIVFVAGILTQNSVEEPAVIDGFAAIRSAIEQDKQLASFLDEEDFVYFSYSGQYSPLAGTKDADFQMPLYEVQDTLPKTVLLVSQMEEFRQHLGALIEAHAEDRIILIGHSMGGVVATYWAATSAQVRRDQVELIVTIDSPLQGTQWADIGDLNDLPPSSSVIDVVRKAGSKERLFTIRNVNDRLVGPEDSRLDDAWYDFAGDYCYLMLCVVPEGLSRWELADAMLGGHGAVLQHPSVTQELVRVIKYLFAVPAPVGSGVPEGSDIAQRYR